MFSNGSFEATSFDPCCPQRNTGIYIPVQSVFVVTINYRLSVLANIYLTELIDENSDWPTAGNYNYLDILSALRWINMNIHDCGAGLSTSLFYSNITSALQILNKIVQQINCTIGITRRSR